MSTICVNCNCCAVVHDSDNFFIDEIISFRVSKKLSSELEKYGRENFDDFGRNLNVNKAARKIILEALLEKKTLKNNGKTKYDR